MFKRRNKIMAKNWKVGEAVRAIQAGNTADILDLGRRFPLFTVLAAQTNEAGAKLLDCIPDYVSARKIESVLKGDAQETEADTDAEEEAVETEEETPKKAPAKKAPEKKAPAKEKAAKAKKEEDDEDGLESKSAKELFEMCKEAGLKVKPKQDKAVYIKALKDAEAKTEEAEDDDWGEEEEEAPVKKPEKKAAPKKAAKKAVEEDDDDDWEV